MIIEEEVKRNFRTFEIHPRETDEDILKRLIITAEKDKEAK